MEIMPNSVRIIVGLRGFSICMTPTVILCSFHYNFPWFHVKLLAPKFPSEIQTIYDPYSKEDVRLLQD